MKGENRREKMVYVFDFMFDLDVLVHLILEAVMPMPKIIFFEV